MFLPSLGRLPRCWKPLSLLSCDFYTVVKLNEHSPPRSISHFLPSCKCPSSGASSPKGLSHLSLLDVGLLSTNLINVSHPALTVLNQ